MSQALSIHWFRQDLRLEDNPSLCYAVEQGTLLPIYILDDEHAATFSMGEASRCWLHHALESLNQQLKGQLRIYRGPADKVIESLCTNHSIDSISWNRCYEPWQRERDQGIKLQLESLDIACKSFNGSLLWEPWKVLKTDQTPYKVFTPYFRKGCLQNQESPRAPVAAPQIISFAAGNFNDIDLSDLNLLPDKDWHSKLVSHWQIDEAGGHRALYDFLENNIITYKSQRDFPSERNTSYLSPYLHWGQLSPHQVWHALQLSSDSEDVDHFKSELGWREFSHYLLHHFPQLPNKNLQSKFDVFPWKNNKDHLQRWQQGLTGFPLIDAGMRELWQTGFMHNRVRMVAASFLVKNLNIHWHHGANWFWDCLFDADLANNSASWQWVAGCGADAAPFFRIFNPITQGEKFDSSGEYTRTFLPELKHLPDKFLFKPWQAPDEVLKDAGIELGKDYPRPIIDLKTSRQEALDNFAQVKAWHLKNPY